MIPAGSFGYLTDGTAPFRAPGHTESTCGGLERGESRDAKAAGRGRVQSDLDRFIKQMGPRFASMTSGFLPVQRA